MTLPVVDPAVAANVNCGLNKPDGEYIREQLERLEDENPTIAFFIRTFAKKSKDKRSAALCGLIVYRLLESQAEADQMAEDFG